MSAVAEAAPAPTRRACPECGAAMEDRRHLGSHLHLAHRDKYPTMVRAVSAAMDHWPDTLQAGPSTPHSAYSWRGTTPYSRRPEPVTPDTAVPDDDLMSPAEVARKAAELHPPRPVLPGGQKPRARRSPDEAPPVGEPISRTTTRALDEIFGSKETAMEAKPFACSKCDEAFTRQNGLSRHLNQTHGIKGDKRPKARITVPVRRKPAKKAAKKPTDALKACIDRLEREATELRRQAEVKEQAAVTLRDHLLNGAGA